MTGQTEKRNPKDGSVWVNNVITISDVTSDLYSGTVLRSQDAAYLVVGNHLTGNMISAYLIVGNQLTGTIIFENFINYNIWDNSRFERQTQWPTLGLGLKAPDSYRGLRGGWYSRQRSENTLDFSLAMRSLAGKIFQ